MSEFNPGILILVAIVIAAAVFMGKGKKKKKAPKPATPAGRKWWRLNHSPGMAEPTPIADGVFALSLQGDPSRHVHAVEWYDHPPLSVGQKWRMRYVVTGDGFVAVGAPGAAVYLTPMVQRRGDNLSAEGAFQGFRYYLSRPLPLTPGEHDETFHLALDELGDVRGQDDAAALAATLADPYMIGFGLGHESGRAHGVYSPGPAELRVLALEPVA